MTNQPSGEWSDIELIEAFNYDFSAVFLRKALASINAVRRAPEEPSVDIKQAVDKFLMWPLPADFYPDCYVNFNKVGARETGCWPVGTNLLTATQAEAMLRHCLAPLNPPPPKPDDTEYEEVPVVRVTVVARSPFLAGEVDEGFCAAKGYKVEHGTARFPRPKPKPCPQCGGKGEKK